MPPYPPLSPAEAMTQAVAFALAWVDRAQDIAEGRPGLTAFRGDVEPARQILALTLDEMHGGLKLESAGGRHVDVDCPF